MFLSMAIGVTELHGRKDSEILLFERFSASGFGFGFGLGHLDAWCMVRS